MKDKEIIEGNKLIAEFMEVKIGVDTYMYRPGVTDLLREDHLSYHSSWGWLMPVAKKIQKLEIEEFKRKKPVMNALFDIQIETLWDYTIEFIKWYNEQPK